MEVCWGEGEAKGRGRLGRQGGVEGGRGGGEEEEEEEVVRGWGERVRGFLVVQLHMDVRGSRNGGVEESRRATNAV